MNAPTEIQTDRTQRSGIFYALVAVLIWSGWSVISREAVTGNFSVFDITAIRYTVAGIILLPIVIRKGLKIGPLGIFGGFILAVLMGAPYNLLSVGGMAFAPVSHVGALINGTMLVYTTFLGILFLREKLSVLNKVGILLSILGIAMMFFTQSDNHHPQEFFGHILFVSSAIFWGTYVILLKKWKGDYLHTVAVVCVFSMIFYLPIYFFFLPHKIFSAPVSEVIFQGVYHGIINSIFAHTAFNKSIELLGATKSSAFMPLVPVFAIILAIPLLGEMPSTIEWSSTIIVTIGVFLASRAAKLL